MKPSVDVEGQLLYLDMINASKGKEGRYRNRKTYKIWKKLF